MSNVVATSSVDDSFKSIVNYPYFSIYPPIGKTKLPKKAKSSQYPDFDTYPATMDDAVDAAVVTASWRCAQSTNTFSYGHYPNVVIYPPFNNASVTTSVSRRNSARSEYTTNVRSTVSYPYFDICEFS